MGHRVEAQDSLPHNDAAPPPPKGLFGDNGAIEEQAREAWRGASFALLSPTEPVTPAVADGGKPPEDTVAKAGLTPATAATFAAVLDGATAADKNRPPMAEFDVDKAVTGGFTANPEARRFNGQAA